jgi:hypothetical protein
MLSCGPVCPKAPPDQQARNETAATAAIAKLRAQSRAGRVWRLEAGLVDRLLRKVEDQPSVHWGASRVGRRVTGIGKSSTAFLSA